MDDPIIPVSLSQRKRLEVQGAPVERRQQIQSGDRRENAQGRTPQRELEILRVSVARLAQFFHVETEHLPVLDAPFELLVEMARNDRGWNALSAEILSAQTERIRTGQVRTLPDEC